MVKRMITLRCINCGAEFKQEVSVKDDAKLENSSIDVAIFLEFLEVALLPKLSGFSQDKEKIGRTE